MTTPSDPVRTAAMALRAAALDYMAAFGQGLEAHGIPYGPQQEEADHALRAALALPVEQPRVAEPAWISVEERLPTKDVEVLVWIAHPTWAAEPYAAVETWCDHREDPLGMGGPTIITGCGWSDNEFEHITHWMPLPASPSLPDQPAEDSVHSLGG